VEQILLYVVTISGFSGFLLGLYSLLIPVLQRRGFRLPFAKHYPDEEDDFEYEDDELDSRHFAATSFSTRRTSLLERLPGLGAREDEPEGEEDEDDSEDEELLGDLDLSKELAEVEAEDGDEYEDDELAELTYEAEVDPVLEDLAGATGLEDEGGEADADEDGDEDEDEDGDEDEEYEDDEEQAEPEAPVVQVVSGGGLGHDMLALFGEGSDVAKEVETWRADLPDTSIAELLAEARAINAMIKGKRPPA
jgi:hypothetical protein